jgi:omega-6 fatty acid desaturase (delta-12 desaturase)
VLGFLCLQIVVARGAVCAAIVLPFLVWNWLMGFIIFNHHTHSSVRFFKNRAEWRFFEGQIRGTVHVVFPRAVGFFLNHIMEHTAHHCDVNIPCYRLRKAQQCLEQKLAYDLVVETWTWKRFLATLRCCQLYDYDRHCWVGFASTLKHPAILERRI